MEEVETVSQLRKIICGLSFVKPFNAHVCPLSPKFQFYFKKGSSKNSYERRAYESVDEQSLS